MKSCFRDQVFDRDLCRRIVATKEPVSGCSAEIGVAEVAGADRVERLDYTRASEPPTFPAPSIPIRMSSSIDN